MLDVHGDQGQSWINRLHELIRGLEHDWAIQIEAPFPDCNYNFVAPARLSDGAEAVLKVSVPGEHLMAEAKSLEAYGGNGAPKLLERDLERGALLMERIRPGTDIVELPSTDAVAAAIEVMEKLHRAPIPRAALPSVRQWGEGFDRLRDLFDGGTGPLPGELVRAAEQVFRELAGSMGVDVLLHGDLHHMNILAMGGSSWVAIDPQGVIGERAYEIGAFLRNPMPAMLDWPNLVQVQRERLILFAEHTGVSQSRIANWGFSQAVLSAIWSLEDHGRGWEGAIRVAHSLRDLAFA